MVDEMNKMDYGRRTEWDELWFVNTRSCGKMI